MSNFNNTWKKMIIFSTLFQLECPPVSNLMFSFNGTTHIQWNKLAVLVLCDREVLVSRWPMHSLCKLGMLNEAQIFELGIICSNSNSEL